LTSIDRTAYPRFRGIVPARELVEWFTPTPEETAWARGKTTTDQTFLALVTWLRCYQRQRRFPELDEVPAVVVEHIRTGLGLPDDVAAAVESVRSAARYRDHIREWLGVKYDAADVRGVAEAAIRAAAVTKDNPADLINVALEELLQAGRELPGYSTLDRMVAKIRTEVNTGVFTSVSARIIPGQRAKLSELPDVWLRGIPPGKISNFAGEAKVTDAPDMVKVNEAKRRSYSGARTPHTPHAGRRSQCRSVRIETTTTGSIG